MKFETYEKYLAEQQSNAEKSGQVQEKAVEAESKYRSLIVEWETTMAESIKTGKDVTKTLEQLDEKIDKTKREMERAVRERDVYIRVYREVSVTADTVIAAWNSQLNPQYYEKEIMPALAQLEAAKKTYYEAMCAYFDKVYEFEDFREEVSNQLGFEFPYRFHIRKLERQDEFDKYFVTQSDFDRAQSRRR
ncbi:hypothetical protein QNK12_09965 [Neobacillus cucumis]|nr:hypothetical protein QNK12_09965 [Neobacillus cucumis]